MGESRGEGWSFGRALHYDPAELELRLEKEGRITLPITQRTALILAKERGECRDPETRYWGEVWHEGLRAGTVIGRTVNDVMRRATGELARVERKEEPRINTPPEPPRRHVASDGQIYVVYLSPLEGRTGVEYGARAVVFVREGDGAVTSARVPFDTDPRWLSGSDLDDLLAKSR